MCPMKGPEHMKEDANRWPKYANLYRLACHKAVENAIKKGKKRKGAWEDGERMYQWWIGNNTSTKEDDNIISIFE